MSKIKFNLHSYVSTPSSWGILKYGFGGPKYPERRTAIRGILVFAIFGAVKAIFNSIFVLEAVRVDPQLILSTNGTNYGPVGGANTTDFVLIGNINEDPCLKSITASNCTYDIAIPALSAQLISQNPYQLSRFTNTQPNSTRGVSLDILASFHAVAIQSQFGNEQRQVCLPVLPEKSVSCTTDETGLRTSYYQSAIVNGFEVFIVTIHPGTTGAESHVRVSFQNGTMTIRKSRLSGESNKTVIAASGIYADLISQLSNGIGQNATSNELTVVCQISTTTLWRWVTLKYDNNLLTAESIASIQSNTICRRFRNEHARVDFESNVRNCRNHSFQKLQ